MWAPPPSVKKKPACCRPPRPWIPAGSPGWPRTSSTGSTPPAPWPRPTGRISDGISTLANPQDCLVRLDGVLDTEGGATLRTALQAFMKPIKDDARSYGQRCADAVVALARQCSGAKRDGAAPRPQLIIRASLDTLAGTLGAPAGELEGGGTVPAETVQRYACDSAISRVT